MNKFSFAKAGATQAKPSLFDKPLLAAVVILIILGLVMVASASIEISEKQFGTPFHYLLRQSIFLIIAIVACRYIFTIPIEKVETYSPQVFIVALVLLCLVLVPHLGKSVNGSTRWLGVGPIGLQVSEFAKLAVILYLAGYLVRRNEEIKMHMSGFLKPMVILAIVTLLLIKEPDFGASVVIMLTALGMMFLSGMRLINFIVVLGVAVVAMACLAISSPYRIHRLTSFLNPWEQAYGSGYQLTQSLIAFGNGGIWGVGLGNSVQKLFYLPEAYTDFLFAVLAEELGLIGIFSVFILYCIVFVRSLFIGKRALEQNMRYGAYAAYGIGLWLGFQFLINVGVNAGALPTKGLTLPLMSYGGSSLLIDCCAIALLFRIDYEARLKVFGMQATPPFRQRR